MSLELRMEGKERSVDTGTQGNRAKALSFFQELKEELRKVTWTTKQELKFFTKIVIVATFVFGLGIYVIDLLMKGSLDGVGVLWRMIFG